MTTKYDTGGDAFPCPVGVDEYAVYDMTWVDYAAIHLMGGLSANNDDGLASMPETQKMDARRCYNMAEALLAEKRKREKGSE